MLPESAKQDTDLHIVHAGLQTINIKERHACGYTDSPKVSSFFLENVVRYTSPDVLGTDGDVQVQDLSDLPGRAWDRRRRSGTGSPQGSACSQK